MTIDYETGRWAKDMKRQFSGVRGDRDVPWPYMRCAACGKIVKVNKFLFGSLHLCELGGEE